MPEVTSQAVLKRWMAFELRRRREAASMPTDSGGVRKVQQNDAAQLLGCKREKIAHLESGRNVPTKLEVEALFDLYGCPDDVGWFLEMVKKIDRRRRTNPPERSHEPSRYGLYAGLEEGAAAVEGADLVVLNGLAQTRASAELMMRSNADLSEEEVEERTEHRLQRQAILHREGNPVKLWLVVAWSVLEDLPGSKADRHEQLGHLLELGALSNIDLQVLRRGAGVHKASRGPFTKLTFAIPGDHGLVYVETATKGLFFEEQEEIEKYDLIMNDLRAKAADQGESRRWIENLWKETK